MNFKCEEKFSIKLNKEYRVRVIEVGYINIYFYLRNKYDFLKFVSLLLHLNYYLQTLSSSCVWKHLIQVQQEAKYKNMSIIFFLIWRKETHKRALT